MNFHARRFGRAAASYGAHAQVQASMADTLMGALPAGFAPAPAIILEFGCGTGLLTRELRGRFPQARLLASDASDLMLAAARAELPGGRIDWLSLDAGGQAEVPGVLRTAGPCGLAASNALVQWFPDLRPHFSWTAARLAAGGAYLVSGFTPENFPELNAILAEPPFGYRSFPGNSPADVTAAAAAAGLRVETWREDSLVMEMPSPEAFLGSIRALGSARRPETGRPLTRSGLEHLKSEYRARYGSGAGVKVTWRPWYALLRKP